jgi:RNA polymerase sigma factor (sigma-70 family)
VCSPAPRAPSRSEPQSTTAGSLREALVLIAETAEQVTSSALESLLRDEWGRLLALLVAQYRRLDLAEDGLADAFEAAARTWPAGVPDNPPAWLLTTARRRIVDRLRAEAVAARKLPLLAVEADLQEEAQRVMADAGEPVRDERLRLVLLCAHPTLPPESAAALTLRLVLGVPTEDVARLFLVSTPTMAARLTRARRKLGGASFAVPAGVELVGRVGIVADVAYLAFTAGYAPGSGPDVLRADVAGEAIRLVRVLRSVLPPSYDGAVELDALLALMLIQHSRRDARVSGSSPVLLPDQDRTLWHVDEALEALDLLRPHVDAPPSPYLLQALIAAEHAVARSSADTDWDRIVLRYEELETLTGSPVVRLNRAVAVAEASGPGAGLALLEGLVLPGHRLPATRAELLARAGRLDQARTSYDEAIGRCANLAERAHLIARRARL